MLTQRKLLRNTIRNICHCKFGSNITCCKIDSSLMIDSDSRRELLGIRRRLENEKSYEMYQNLVPRLNGSKVKICLERRVECTNEKCYIYQNGNFYKIVCYESNC